jgi:hypothetical protein
MMPASPKNVYRINTLYIFSFYKAFFSFFSTFGENIRIEENRL